MALMALAALGVLNAVYGCEGSFQRLGDYQFISSALSGKDDVVSLQVGNRFRETPLARLPLPVPRNYLLGLDRQKWDFERKMWSYLAGRWQFGGWWYYYLYALAVKVPLGMWLLGLLAPVLSVRDRRYRTRWRDDLVLLAPPIALFALVSSQTGFSHHLRYVLPVFPFAFVWAGKAARAVNEKHRKTACLAAAALAWFAASSLWVYPHTLSYFNELGGGPSGGPDHLTDSNADWGQDLLCLKRWQGEHPEARPLEVALFVPYDPQDVGIAVAPAPIKAPAPGWYAVSASRIRHYSSEYEYFRHLRPLATAAYSISIYHVTLEEADRCRRDLGLRYVKLPYPNVAETAKRTLDSNWRTGSTVGCRIRLASRARPAGTFPRLRSASSIRCAVCLASTASGSGRSRACSHWRNPWAQSSPTQPAMAW